MSLGGSRPRGRRAAGGWAPCAALALGWALGWALGAEPPHRCRPDTALLPPPLRRLGGSALLRAAVPRLPRGAWSPCQLYRYPPGAPRPNGTGPCTRGWHYALPAAGLRANLVTQVGLGLVALGGSGTVGDPRAWGSVRCWRGLGGPWVKEGLREGPGNAAGAVESCEESGGTNWGVPGTRASWGLQEGPHGKVRDVQGGAR